MYQNHNVNDIDVHVPIGMNDKNEKIQSCDSLVVFMKNIVFYDHTTLLHIHDVAK